MQRLTTHGLMLSLLVFVSLYTQATPQSSAQTRTEFQYAAKFVCGKSDGELAAHGQYFTIINVHNPFMKQVKFRKKFALGGRGENVGKIFGFFPTPRGGEGLGPDKVMGIDCPDIYKHSGISEGNFIEGYAVLHCPPNWMSSLFSRQEMIESQLTHGTRTLPKGAFRPVTLPKNRTIEK